MPSESRVFDLDNVLTVKPFVDHNFVLFSIKTKVLLPSKHGRQF